MYVTRADKIFSYIYRWAGAFVLICFGSYFLKLIISPEGTLPWVATTTVILAVSLPYIFRSRLRTLLGKVYLPLKALMCAGMVLYAFSFAALVGYIYLSPAAHPGDSGEGQLYLVFGAKVKAEGPTKTLASRLRLAAEAMLEDESGIAIVSGGQGPDEPFTEASCMKEYMVSLGVPAERILLEERASNTRENIDYSVALAEEAGLADRKLVCVSSETHIPRIRLMCRRSGVEAQYMKAETPEKAFLFTAWVREYLSYVKMFVMGG